MVKHCQAEIEAFLRALTPEDLFRPATWKHFAAFVRVMPDGDVLPSRAKYSKQSNDWQVAVNHVYAANNDPNNALWFSLPDVIFSVLHTSRVPKIVDAFRLEPHGTLPGLQKIRLRGAIEVDPGNEDFFRVVIQERKRLAKRTDLTDIEKAQLDKALKVLANAASYGIYAEMIRQETEKRERVTCYGIDPDPYVCRVTHPDVPGEYCFPPLASLITGAARLMLGLLEHCVAEFGGTYAMEDTDSMAIVATKRGGFVPCAGGRVKALSWKQVQEIRDRFAALNPYDRDAIPGSVLKIEEDNRDLETGNQRQIHCFAISAKRYALFLLDGRGEPVLLRKGINNKDDRWSEHGLGHLLNPTDPNSEDRDWIAQVWLNMIRRALGLPTVKLPFENLAAVGRVSVSSPAVMRSLAKFNAGKRYCDQIKPFNFLLTCHIKQLGHPPGVDPEHFHLIAPYSTDPKQWVWTCWINQYDTSGKQYRITTAGFHGDRRTARVKTYGDALEEYEYHPESKCADADGNPCGKQTIGLLHRRHITIEQIKYIGKESNSLEDVESGLVHALQNVYTEYPDPRRDEWQTMVLPVIKKARLSQLVSMTGISRSELQEIRAGRSRPRLKNQDLLANVARKLISTVYDPERKR